MSSPSVRLSIKGGDDKSGGTDPEFSRVAYKWAGVSSDSEL